MRTRLTLYAIFAVCASAQPALGQHDMAGMAGMSSDSGAQMSHLMLRAIPLITEASPSAGGISRTQLALTQTVAMYRGAWWKGHAALDATLNGEGLSMPDGELNTGAAGEGYVDKRHPHTYLHELIFGLSGGNGNARASMSAGRGFATFGTDDPMMRPLTKYPVNHHLSQILERAVLSGALHAGAATFEASTFNGDEPTSPSSLPRMRRFGDSWALRGTVGAGAGTEVQASYARVASPEQVSGHGLDQRKQSISARHSSHEERYYGLVEWARTSERDHGRGLDAFAYESVLAEGAVSGGNSRLSLRLEQTAHPEEERLADPFRTPRPGSDLSIGGITQWRVATVQVQMARVSRRFLNGYPFAEVARLYARSLDARSIATPQRLYGTSHFWMVTAGVRLEAGMTHHRMGRYGVAVQ